MFAAYNYDSLGLAHNLASIGASFGWLWTFMAIVGAQVAYFLWLAAVLRKAVDVAPAKIRQTSSSSRMR